MVRVTRLGFRVEGFGSGAQGFKPRAQGLECKWFVGFRGLRG